MWRRCSIGAVVGALSMWLGWADGVRADDRIAIAVRGAQVQLFGPVTAEAPAGNAGVFVGVCKFEHDESLPTLVYSTHDAIELAYLFAFDLRLIPAQNCYLLLSGDPVAESVKSHLDQLRQAGAKVTGADRSRILQTLRQAKAIATENDQVLVCSFSSHGFDDRGTPYVMPSDGVKDDLLETGVALQTIELRMQESNAGHRLLLVDACQERSSARSAGGAATGQPLSPAFAEALRKPSGQAKLASCSPREFSFEHGSLGGVGHGVFTYEFLQALRGGAQADDQSIVRLGAVADYVATHVTAWTNENTHFKQTPFFAGPQESVRLPLAAKADDLTTLLTTIEKHPLSAAFTADLRAALVAYLRTLKTAEGADRELIYATRSFLNGQLTAGVFSTYVRGDQVRWSSTRVLPSSSVVPSVGLGDAPLFPPRPTNPPLPSTPTTPEDVVPPPAWALRSPFGEKEISASRDMLKRALSLPERKSNTVGMVFALIPPGEFRMGGDQAPEEVDRLAKLGGAPYSDPSLSGDEHPAHLVRITHPYYVGVVEVTQSQWTAVMGNNPSWFARPGVGATEFLEGIDTSNCPVEQVSRNDCVSFCNKLSELEGLELYYKVAPKQVVVNGERVVVFEQNYGGSGYRLLTEAEWEYACRAGTTTPFHFGSSNDGTASNVDGTSPYGTTTPGKNLRWTADVARYSPNAFGLWDMHGSVWEWCEDKYDASAYTSRIGTTINPLVDSGANGFAHRGGSWMSYPRNSRSASRRSGDVDEKWNALGLRVARTP